MPKATVYTREGCMMCIATKKVLESLKFDVNMIDITNDENLEDEVRGLGFKSLPVVIIDDARKTMWSGFRPDLMQQVARGY